MEKLRIAIQKSGRLSEETLKLLKECGIGIPSGNNRLKAEASGFPAEIFFLRDDDIPQYVEDGVADVGIVGENVLLEKEKNVGLVERLGFGKCRLSLAVSRNVDYRDLSYFNGKKIATSYPVILSGFLQKEGIRAEIHEISGSVEIAPGIGLADGICDLVSSGSTLLMNGLKETEVVLKSEAVLISSQRMDPARKALLEKMLFRIQAVRKAQNNKYVLLNAPNEKIPDIIRILPGMKSPTVLPLAIPGWSSVHSVLNEDDFWNRIEELKQNGAQGILVVPIEKMVL